ncbi:MAG: GNAT family N-acetyltransferase [Bacteroidota bacterium]|nr:GNAT family N-acetyltransferase [Bacteroidota bacterium]
MIKIEEVKNNSDLKKFIKFPFKLYQDSKYWVPPIISEEINIFNSDINPALKNANVSLYIAIIDNEIVGRIAAIINSIEVNEQKTKKIRFGWFDVIDDLNVTKKLIDKVIEIGKANNLEYMEGPMGFSNLDKVGVLTYGFDKIGTMVTWYNHPYYSSHFKKLNFTVEKKYSEKTFSFQNIDIDYYFRMSKIIQRRYDFKAVNFNKIEDALNNVNEMFDLFNKSYSKLSSFVEINDIQKEYIKNKFLRFINPNFITFVFDKNNNIIGFAIIMPSYAKALQKMKGKLYPFGFFHLINARKYVKNVTLYLIGIHPDHQNKGVTAILFDSLLQNLKGKGIEDCHRMPELVENDAIDKIWKNFNPVLRKKRCTYRKAL